MLVSLSFASPPSPSGWSYSIMYPWMPGGLFGGASTLLWCWLHVTPNSGNVARDCPQVFRFLQDNLPQRIRGLLEHGVVDLRFEPFHHVPEQFQEVDFIGRSASPHVTL